jgi:hypothetical protein
MMAAFANTDLMVRSATQWRVSNHAAANAKLVAILRDARLRRAPQDEARVLNRCETRRAG